MAAFGEAKTYSKSTGTPWPTTADLAVIRECRESGLVPEGNEDHPVVDERANGVDDRLLLSTTLRCGGDEDAGVLAPVGTSLPLSASLVPEGLVMSVSQLDTSIVVSTTPHTLNCAG